jgi:hypothetical protein
LGTAVITLTFLPALTIAVLRGAGYAAKPAAKPSRKKPSGMAPAPGE